MRVVTSGTTKIKKITRGPGSGTTVVKKVTVGVPTRIGDPSTGAIRNLDDVNDRVNQSDRSFLLYNDSSGLYLHKDFDSEVKDLIGTSSITAGLAWETSGHKDQIRTATKYIDSDQEEYTIRSTAFNSNLLELTLAFFSPTLTATGQSLYWDQPATQFTVTLDNPDDFLTQYIDSAVSITELTGTVTENLLAFTASAKSAEPDGGVDWNQTFSTVLNQSNILSNGSGLTGGSASARIAFNSFKDDSSTLYDSDATFTTNWQDASVEVEFGNLTGNTFLQTYSTVPYTLTKNGVQTPSNHTATITGAGGTLSSSTGSGTFTFTNPLHKDNNSGLTLGATCSFVRPTGIVPSGGYTIVDSAEDTTISATFTFPSFWIFTASVASPPLVADVVVGTSYKGTVNTLLDEQRTFAGYVNNTAAVPQAFWFAVRSSASQPTSFQTGSGPGLLVNASVTNGSVSLEPTSPPSGYSAEAFSLYGITLNPGNTYVSIS